MTWEIPGLKLSTLYKLFARLGVLVAFGRQCAFFHDAT
jgi:hypothetical protein